MKCFCGESDTALIPDTCTVAFQSPCLSSHTLGQLTHGFVYDRVQSRAAPPGPVHTMILHGSHPLPGLTMSPALTRSFTIGILHPPDISRQAQSPLATSHYVLTDRADVSLHTHALYSPGYFRCYMEKETEDRHRQERQQQWHKQICERL